MLSRFGAAVIFRYFRVHVSDSVLSIATKHPINPGTEMVSEERLSVLGDSVCGSQDSLTYSHYVLDDGLQGVFEHAASPGSGLDPRKMGGPAMEVHQQLPTDESFELFISRYNTLCLVGSLAALEAHPFCRDVVARFPKGEVGGSSGGITSTLVPDTLNEPKRVFLLTPATTCSRHNSPARPDSVTSLLMSSFPNPKSGERIGFVVASPDPDYTSSLVLGIGRVFPAYSRKTSARSGGKIGEKSGLEC